MSFEIQVGGFVKKTKDRIQKIRRGTIISLFGSVIMDTPVLSGRLRANWKFGEGSPELSTDQTIDKTGGPTVSKTINSILGAGDATTLYLSNSLPYAYRIEFEGWSHTKAPEGMMRKNVARFQNLIVIKNRE